MANATTRSSTMLSLKTSGQLSLSIANGYNYSGLAVLNPFVSNETADATKIGTFFPISMLTNPLWQLYRNLYDEFRIVRVGCKITGLSPVGAGQAMGGCKIITYWDRSNKIRDFYTGNLISLTNMINMPGARAHSFTNNSQVKCWTAVRASDLVEKITYTDVDIQPYTLGAASSGFAHDQTGHSNATWTANSSSAFNPTCYVCVYSPVQNNSGNPWPVSLMIDLYATVEMRNPKYTSQAVATMNGTKTIPFDGFRITQEQLTDAFRDAIKDNNPDGEMEEMEAPPDQSEAS